MNTNRIWVLGSVVIIVVLLAATWFLGVSPQLATAALSSSDKIAVDAQNSVAQATVASLKTQFEQIDSLRAELKKERVVMPSSKDQGPLLSNIGSYAKSAGVTVTSLTFQDATPYIDGQSLDPELAGVLGLVSSANLLVVPFDTTVKGEVSDLMSFVDKLQNGERIVLVHDLTLGSEPDEDGNYTLTLASEAFVLLDSASVPAAEVPADPSAPVVTDPAAPAS